MTSIIAIAVVWRLILGTDAGLLNGLLEQDRHRRAGLADRSALVVVVDHHDDVWHGLGLQMIIFLAGLQAIPNELYEAASVDGARRWHKFRYVTLPMLRPTLLFSTVIASIGLIQVFEEPYVMTQGGPLDSTLTVAFHAYNQFSLRQLRRDRGDQPTSSFSPSPVLTVDPVQVPPAERREATTMTAHRRPRRRRRRSPTTTPS